MAWGLYKDSARSCRIQSLLSYLHVPGPLTSNQLEAINLTRWSWEFSQREDCVNISRLLVLVFGVKRAQGGYDWRESDTMYGKGEH